MLLGALVPSLDQCSLDIDTGYISAELRGRQRRRAIAAAHIQHLHSFRDPEFLHERLAALAHRISDPREIAFFPKCFVRIRRSIHKHDLIVSFAWSQSS